MAETHFLMDRSNNHRCLWCNDPYPYRNTGGKPQRFCSAPCRLEFHKATRKWAIEAIERGELTVDQIREALGATYTLGTERSRVVRHLGHAKPRADSVRRLTAPTGESALPSEAG